MPTRIVPPDWENPMHMVFAAVISPELSPLISSAAKSAGLATVFVNGDTTVMARRLASREAAMAVVEVKAFGTGLSPLIELLRHFHPLPPALILIASNAGEALEAGVEVGGCVHHLFTEIPSTQHLCAFLTSAREKQAKTLSLLAAGTQPMAGSRGPKAA